MLNDLEQGRFWAKVIRAGQSECWLWTGAKTPAGYGKMNLAGAFRYAHHLSLILDGRERPEGAITLHSCDNPSCVNPRHLSWGDQGQNMRQAQTRGRAPHHGRVPGMKNGNSRLTDDQVRAIREAGGTNVAIAATYGVSASLISQIRLRTAWKHL
jgi:hypothetical protein